MTLDLTFQTLENCKGLRGKETKPTNQTETSGANTLCYGI